MAEAAKPGWRQAAWVVATASLAAAGAYLFTLSRSVVEDAVDGPPLRVRVVGERDFLTERPLVVSALVTDPARTVADLTADDVEAFGWYATTHGWSDVATAVHAIRLEFRTDEAGPVVIERIVPRLVARAAPKTGWFIARGGCGVLPIRRAGLDLDAPTPTVTPRAADGARLAKLFVTRDEVEILQVEAVTERHYVEWVLDVEYSASSGTGSLRIDDDGAPFKLSSEVGSAAYRLDWQTRSFERHPAWDDGIDMC